MALPNLIFSQGTVRDYLPYNILLTTTNSSSTSACAFPYKTLPSI